MPWQLWLAHQPHCWLSDHHSVFHHRLPHQPHHCTVGRLVITPTCPVGCPIRPTTPLSADWSSLRHALLAVPSVPPPHCWLTGHHSNPTVGHLVTTPTYPVGHPISPISPTVGQLVTTPTDPVGQLVITPTPLSADWSSLQHALSAVPSDHHHTVGRLVITPTPLSAAWSPLQHTLSAAPSAPPPHCWPPHQTHHPTVSQLVTLTGHHLHLPCWPPS